MKKILIRALFVFVAVALLSLAVFAADFVGQFDPALVANKSDHEQVVLKLVTRDKLKGVVDFPATAHLAAKRIIDPRTQKYSVLALLVEQRGEVPIMYVDLDGDDSLSPDEKIAMKPSLDDNPYLWGATAELKMKKEGVFKTCPIFIQYFKSYRTDEMGSDDRLITQSTEVMARGRVDIKGKTIIFQYAYNADDNKVNPQSGWLGVDVNGDGDVDLGKMSPESTKANEESVIFRIGETYVSTKKADVSKNQIVVTEREAKDYKRVEVYINKEFPEFSFTDFEGKKRRFSEYRGKYVLLDIWGFWCPPCRRELPYLREAHRRFASRNLEIIGLNTDENFTVDSMRKGMKDAGMTWTNAQFESVIKFLRETLRVNSFPTTFLIDPQGKVLSIGRTERDELDLRGKDLLESLETTLPNL